MLKKNLFSLKNTWRFPLIVTMLFLAVNGCSKAEKASLPEEPPTKVVEKFFSFLKSGGKRTLEEAQKLTTSGKAGVSSEAFRRWTEMYDPETEITILESKVLDQLSKNGEKLAEVTLGFKVPSAFGGHMNSKSLMHLVLDRESNTWKIDFLAETINEEGFKKEG